MKKFIEFITDLEKTMGVSPWMSRALICRPEKKRITTPIRGWGDVIKKNWLVIFIIIVGVLLRIYQSELRFLYGHDQDLGAWFVKDVLINKHLRLIGQETSTQGVFIGPLFYYLLIPFFIISGMDPIGGLWLVITISIFGLISVYFVFAKVFGKNTALFALIFYSFSQYIIFNDKEVVPTMPVILWTVWLIYVLDLILKGRQKKGFALGGLLVGLVWHLNFALILIVPLIFLAALLSRKKIAIINVCYGVITSTIFLLPFIFFELRHNFSQVKWIIRSLITNQSDIVSGFDKFKRIIYLLSKDLHALLIGEYPGIKFEWVFYSMIAIFVLLIVKKLISRHWALIFFSWILFYIIFFSSYSKIVSEYYLNGTIIVFIAIVSIFISYFVENIKLKHIGFIITGLFIVFSLRRLVLTPINKSGYEFRKQIIQEIKRDSIARGYECVSISYITDPGYNLGYRYFTYLENLKVKPISTNVPVYTIVYPLKAIFPVNETRGIIGLIYPDYPVYKNAQTVNKYCEGDNINITEPLWGFTDK